MYINNYLHLLLFFYDFHIFMERGIGNLVVSVDSNSKPVIV